MSGGVPDQLRLAAGGDALGFRTQLAAEPLEDAIDHARVTVVQTGLNTADRVRANQPFGFAKIDFGQPGGSGEQRGGGDPDSRADDAPQILGSRGDDVEGNGGAEVNNDTRATVTAISCDAVYHAVGADVARVVIANGQAGVGFGCNEERLGLEITVRHARQR